LQSIWSVLGFFINARLIRP